MMVDPKEAHRDEIFEALVDAVLKNNVRNFEFFNTEWERIDPPVEGRTAVRFSGPMRHATCTGVCAHCGYTWTVTGADFTNGDFIAEIAQQNHLFGTCPKKADCRCWVDDVENNESWERCQECNEADILCECPEGAVTGPCVNPDAIVVFLDQPVVSDE